MPLLPKDYKTPEGNYYKLKDGENTFRIVSEAIVGYEYWNNDNKPVRSREEFESTPDIRVEKDGTQSKIKHFWAFLVWNYEAQKVQIMEITQATIQGALKALENNKKWGDTKDYDITIVREGSGFDTTYQVTPNPKEELEEAGKIKVANAKIRLEALYEGNDPFGGIQKTDYNPEGIDPDLIPF